MSEPVNAPALSGERREAVLAALHVADPERTGLTNAMVFVYILVTVGKLPVEQVERMIAGRLTFAGSVMLPDWDKYAAVATGRYDVATLAEHRVYFEDLL